MQEDWIWGLLGGGLIGTAAAIYLLVNGRIMGASGIIGGLVDGSARGEQANERAWFIGGLFLVPAILALLAGGAETYASSNLAVMAVGGLLVGIGTRVANGCTSGHGICGMSRLSLRGMIATVFYILAGGLSVVLFRHILGVI